MIGISSNDAGGAELLSEYVIRNKNQYLFFLSGPAIKIFKKKIINLKTSNFKKSLHKLSMVISSTGWATQNEINIIKECKKEKIKVCAYLDHWVNYKERFQIDKKFILPNEIWVSDKLAFEIAKKEFKNKVKIKQIKNFYFERAKKFFLKRKKITKKNSEINILYLCEPIEAHYKNENFYNEKQCINIFFEKIKFFGKINKIIFRPHPYEGIKKYNWVLDLKKEFNITIKKNIDILNEIANSDVVVGCNTVALYLAVIAKKKVYTSIPNGYVCDIPSAKINYLNKVI